MMLLTVALPKGRMQEPVLELFAQAGYETQGGNGRKLIVPTLSGDLRFILAKPADVPTYVEYGAAGLGVVGLDILRETQHDVYEPLRLGIGKCHLAIAAPAEWQGKNLRLQTNLRVASKYPRLARRYFEERGISAEIIHLNGSIELAPAVGLADLLVDLVQTGRTLRENGLVELEVIMHSEAMLIVNHATHKLYFEAVQEITRRLSQAVSWSKDEEQGNGR